MYNYFQITIFLSNMVQFVETMNDDTFDSFLATFSRLSSQPHQHIMQSVCTHMEDILPARGISSCEILAILLMHGPGLTMQLFYDLFELHELSIALVISLICLSSDFCGLPQYFNSLQ